MNQVVVLEWVMGGLLILWFTTVIATLVLIIVLSILDARDRRRGRVMPIVTRQELMSDVLVIRDRAPRPGPNPPL